MNKDKKKKGWWRRNWRKVTAIGGLLFMVVVLGTALLVQQKPAAPSSTTFPPFPTSSTPQGSTTPGSATQPPPGTSTTGQTPSGGQSVQSSKLAAVEAAFNAEDVIVQALFQDPDTLTKAVDSIAAPSQRQVIAVNLIAAAAITARHLGRYTVEEALHSSYSSVYKMAWKIRSFDGNQAAITLYVETYTVDSVRQWYQVPGKTIIYLTKDDNRWLYYGTKSVPADEAPKSIDGYSRPEIEAMYNNHYLKGFTRCGIASGPC